MIATSFSIRKLASPLFLFIDVKFAKLACAGFRWQTLKSSMLSEPHLMPKLFRLLRKVAQVAIVSQFLILPQWCGTNLTGKLTILRILNDFVLQTSARKARTKEKGCH